MNSRYFLRLATQSIDKQRQTYLPQMIAVSCYVSMFYLLLYLRDNAIIADTLNATVYNYMLSLSVYAFGLFVIVFLIYSNSFLMRPRTKEFGLLYLFGLSQRHLLIIMAYEVVITYAISIGFGLLTGVVLSRLMGMVLSAFIKIPISMLQIVDVQSMLTTIGLFCGVMGIIFVINMVQIISAKPISLLHKSIPAKPARWWRFVVMVIGIACIGYAYWLIVSVDSPQRAFEIMALVVVTIIVGTYCVFFSLSVTILQLLSQRPRLYYQKYNFVIINGLLNRIQFNAIGLASVSVFALMILTMVSMAGVIYFGVDESVQKMYAADIVMTVQEHNIQSKAQFHDQINTTVASQGQQATVTDSFVFLSLATLQKDNAFTYQEQNRVFVGVPNSHYMVLVTATEYNRIYNQSLVLAPNEVAVYSSYQALPDEFTLQEIQYRIVTRLPILSIANYDLEQLVNAHYLVVHDESVLAIHERKKYEQNPEFPSPIRYRVGMNISGDESQKIVVYEDLRTMLAEYEGISRVQQYPNPYIEIVNIQSRQAEKVIFEAVYGVFLFLSLFLGVLFMMSTALLIYYKQLSEGYEDKLRFEILQRVGMTHDEVRVSVNTQIVLLFFIPLMVAGVHFAVSLHLIEHLLELFRIQSLQLLVSAAAITLLVFSVLYLVIYRVSARVYYNIVR